VNALGFAREIGAPKTHRAESIRCGEFPETTVRPAVYNLVGNLPHRLSPNYAKLLRANAKDAGARIQAYTIQHKLHNA
jgi:hypothetical protein